MLPYSGSRNSWEGLALWTYEVFLLMQFLACRFFLTGSDVGFRDASSRFRHKSVNAGRVLKLKLDSELKTSGLCGPASRSPARPPIFSAHPCARWHRSGRRFKYLYCVHTCATGPGVGLPRRYQVLRLMLTASQGLV